MLFIISASRLETESVFIFDEDFFLSEMGIERPSPEEVKNFLFGESWELGVFVKCTAPEVQVGRLMQLPLGFELQVA